MNMGVYYMAYWAVKDLTAFITTHALLRVADHVELLLIRAVLAEASIRYNIGAALAYEQAFIVAIQAHRGDLFARVYRAHAAFLVRRPEWRRRLCSKIQWLRFWRRILTCRESIRTWLSRWFSHHS
jgi:hypothetical protein